MPPTRLMLKVPTLETVDPSTPVSPTLPGLFAPPGDWVSVRFLFLTKLKQHVRLE